MGAGVGGEVGEEPVDPAQVAQVRPRRQVREPRAGITRARERVEALPGDDVVAELVEDVVVRERAAVGFLRPEPVDQRQPAQSLQPPLPERRRREQSTGDLRRGEDTVIVEPAEQEQITVGQTHLGGENLITSRHIPP